MSEEDAEIALLHQLQAGQESGSWEDEGANGAAEGELPSNIEHNNEDVKRETVADDQVLSRALSPTGAVAVPDGGASDPSSVPLPAITIAGEQASRSSSRASSRKQKTVGGFIADDSDEEYDVLTPQTGLQPAAVNTPNRAISPSPLQNSVSQQDLQTTPENQGDSMATQPAKSLPVNPSAAGVPSVPAPASQVLTSAGPSVPGASVPKARLPHDRFGILEDKIKEDPRGDLESWLFLIIEHRKRNKIDEARAVYERFFKVFPQAAEIWVAYLEMELESDNFSAAENIFGRCLLTVPNVQLWSVYLNYIRRRNDLTNDASGAARSTISAAYDFVLGAIGIDKDSGRIWQEYIQFIRSAPGQIGGNTWQDQLKMDQLRKAYQRAIVVPMSTLNGLWKEYDQFELSLNKMTGRKFLQEKSPGYMSARGANSELEKKIRGLVRTTLPKLPPVHGFDGDEEFMQQVNLWKEWIQWEKADPLTLANDELPVYQQRVLYLYKQAAMALRFWPEIWLDAADWCYDQGLAKEGDTFLDEGIVANPESSALAFKKADRLESTVITDEIDRTLAEKGAIVRAPFDKLLDTLYDMIKQLKVREAREYAKLEESLAVDAHISAIISKTEEDDDENDAERKAREAKKAEQTKNIQAGYALQADLISRTISFAWIAMMRAMRRVQGKGSPKDSVGGSRKVFADARARGKLTSDVYVAAALIEHTVYKDPAGTKIFERGAKLFPEDANFTLDYLKHLLTIGDTTNARVTFETVVSRLTQKAEKETDERLQKEIRDKAKPLYAHFHKYESQYGELSQISKLEQRMAELWPEDPKLSRFSARYSSEGFDPTAVRLIISPGIQMRPKVPQVMQSIEQPLIPEHKSPRPQYVQEASPRPQIPLQFLQGTNSPKRPFPVDDSDNELNPPRKLARGQSPLKGAAGRRLDQQKRLQQGTPSWNAPPFVVPRDITFLLSIIPRPEDYKATKFKPDALVRLLRETIVPDYNTWKTAAAEQSQSMSTQTQRYDGMSNNTHNYTQRAGGAGASSQNQYQSYSGSPAPYQASYQNPGSPADPYAQHAQGMNQNQNHQRDAYPRPTGLPPRPQVQVPVGQNWGPQPGSAGAGYDMGAGVASAGGYAASPPQLQTANNWYYRG